MYLRLYVFLLCAICLAHEAFAQSIQNPSFSSRPQQVSRTPISLYLTFDDGPVQGSEQLGLLTAIDSIQLNVFVIGKFVFANDTMRNLFNSFKANSLIELGNHSFSHANRHYSHFYNDSVNAVKDFTTNQDTLGLTNKIARLPGRNMWRVNGKRQNDISNGQSVANFLAAEGYTVFGWDIEWHSDSTGKIIETAGEIINNIEKIVRRKSTFTPNNVVILFHDPMLQNQNDFREIRTFIKMIKEMKYYRFEHLSKYPH